MNVSGSTSVQWFLVHSTRGDEVFDEVNFTIEERSFYPKFKIYKLSLSEISVHDNILFRYNIDHEYIHKMTIW